MYASLSFCRVCDHCCCQCLVMIRRKEKKEREKKTDHIRQLRLRHQILRLGAHQLLLERDQPGAPRTASTTTTTTTTTTIVTALEPRNLGRDAALALAAGAHAALHVAGRLERGAAGLERAPVRRLLRARLRQHRPDLVAHVRHPLVARRRPPLRQPRRRRRPLPPRRRVRPDHSPRRLHQPLQLLGELWWWWWLMLYRLPQRGQRETAPGACAGRRARARARGC